MASKIATPRHVEKLMADYLKTRTVSHSNRVCSLYKRMIRDQYWKYDYMDARFNCLKIRAEFDKNKNIKDTRKAKLMLLKAEEEFVDNMHPHYKMGVETLPFSKDGISYSREELFPDYVMDFYSPIEKSLYPHFFAKREAMKREYLELWNKKMRKPTVKEPHVGGH